MLRILLRLSTAAASLLALTLTATMPAAATELRILSGGAAKSVLLDVFPRAETAGKMTIKAEFTPVGAWMKRLDGGERPDVVVITEDVAEAAKAKGLIDPATLTEVGRVGVGVAVKTGAPRPDISTPEAVTATLRAAKSIVIVDPDRGTSGKHVAAMFERLGIADEVKAKLTKLDGGYVVEKVATGEIELGLHQITEILPVKGVILVGPLPDPLQKVTIYLAAVVPGSPNRAAAQAFLDELKTPATKAVLPAKGFFTN